MPLKQLDLVENEVNWFCKSNLSEVISCVQILQYSQLNDLDDEHSSDGRNTNVRI